VVAAAVLLSAGCSASYWPSAAPVIGPGSLADQPSQRSSPLTAVPSSAAVATPLTTPAMTAAPAGSATLQHWGSFFGNTNGNVDTLASPVNVTLPGAVAQVGTSNSTEYALLGVAYQSLATGSATSYAVSSNGSVYAWGVSYEGQLGDGYLGTALTPVRIASGATAISSTANNVLIK
jgi:regulator of chromosome condensation (RCC1) repeat-containing protein